jgi:charged multivesicular body protein 1
MFRSTERMLEDHLFNLKYTSKQLQRQSKKNDKEVGKEKLKLKKAIEQGNIEGSKIYAENVIRLKNQSLNYLRLSSRIDAVASRVETAMRMRQVTKSMGSICSSMDRAMKTMNIEQMTMIMDKFEKQFEDLDVQAQYMENSMSQTTAVSTPQDEVQSLINQVADEFGLELEGKLDAATPSKETPMVETDDLLARLERLKAPST